MIQHYIKVAIRQILKNKTHYILSVIGIAVGLLCFSMTNYYILKMNSRLTAWDNSGRMARIYTVTKDKPDDFNWYIPGKELQMLLNNPIAGIERIAVSQNKEKENITFYKTDGIEVPFLCNVTSIAESFISVFSIKTLNGETPSIKEGETFISESMAKKVFNGEDPVGKSLCLSQADNDTSQVNYAIITSVIKDLADGTRDKEVVYLPLTTPIQPERFYTTDEVTLLLEEGVTSREINERLAKQIPRFGEKEDSLLFIETYNEILLKPENLLPSMTISLLGALVLIAAMINFLKLSIQSFYNRTKELSLRICFGSDMKGLFYLLFSEVSILLVFAVILTFALTELFLSLYYDYLPEVWIQITFLQVDPIFLMGNQVEYLLLLLAICIGICSLTIYRVKRINLISGVNGKSRNKHAVRNLMLGVQIFICFLFISLQVCTKHCLSH